MKYLLFWDRYCIFNLYFYFFTAKLKANLFLAAILAKHF
ncbi:hypothetical protein AM1_4495 [Acaryochloris marina MBIC11017]|uniref:Uncharacterized protein n=1 Tax=Acaryochloris marina (strain MBIC 11017) TaxID=329726 RepID=B0CG25_ACAM1|nr:hypothetical protein AM1_4495 [Acaryochloris marina MBIC11017]